MLRVGSHVLLTLVTIGYLIAAASSKRVLLRTGEVSLWPLSTSDLGTTTVTRSTSSRVTYDLAYASADAWGDALAQGLFLISYDDDVHAKAIRSALLSRKAAILSYMSDKTLLVVAKPAVAFRVAALLGAEVAEYGSEHRIDPEWAPIMTHSEAEQQQHGGDAEWSPPAAAELQAAKLLSRMQTLNGPAAPAAAPAPAQYGVIVEMLPGLSREALRAAETDWPAALRALLGGDNDDRSDTCRPAVVAPPSPGSDRLSVYLCAQDLPIGVNWLADQPVAKWVAPMVKAQLANALSSVLLQTGAVTREQYDKAATSASRLYRPYWEAGLRGEGEIVGVSDGGLDTDQCYFQDPRFNGSYTEALADLSSAARLGIMSYKQIPEHRKVVQYAVLTAAGGGINTNRHGTLVSGSVAGVRLAGADPLGPVALTEATGAAPGARISFYDGLSEGTNGGNLWITDDVYNYVLPVHQLAGAFITSDSWGSSYTAGYEMQSQGFDKFLWQHPDFISFLAAGNSGRDSWARCTIIPPSVAKNVVAVGAGYRRPPQTASRNVYSVHGVRLDGTAYESPVVPNESYDLPLLSDIIPESGQLPLMLARPLDACQPLRNPAGSIRGAVVVVLMSSCEFYRQAQNVAAAGGAAIIVVPNKPMATYAPNPIDANKVVVIESLPTSMFELDPGLFVISFLYSGGSMKFSSRRVPVESDSVADFSSWGPTPDGRIKPDIIAPGSGIVSASPSDSGSSCSTQPYTGSSAATPVASGHAALMRQYMRTGFYPTGAPTDTLSAPFTPSGILLKALVIAGAESMQGGRAHSKDVVMGPAPDGFQGWGRMSLPGSLPLLGFTDPRFRLQVADRGEFTGAGQSVTLTGITAIGDGPVTVVMAYYDYPADTNALRALVNNLDLIVEVGGAVLLGNNHEGVAFPAADSANTVERVLLHSPPAGAAISIIVEAVDLPSLLLDPATPQRWAVAVVGHFTGTIHSTLNPAWVKEQSLSKPPSSPPPPRSPKQSGRTKQPSPPPKRSPPPKPSRRRVPIRTRFS